MPLSPFSSGYIYHERLSEVSVTVMAQPEEVAQPVEVSSHTSDPSISQIPQLTLDFLPQVSLVAVSYIT